MEQEPRLEPEPDWPRNYFNYFTEIEEHFRAARGTGLFLMSPLDWALLESWKAADVPLEAVRRGIDQAFEKWRSRRKRLQAINSIAYCTQAVLSEARILSGASPGKAAEAAPPFAVEELQEYLESNARHLAVHSIVALHALGESLSRIADSTSDHMRNLEDLERQLTTLEEKMIAIARSAQPEGESLEARRAFDDQLRPYRSKMTAGQISLLERQFLDRRVLESNGLRRLSLFYMGA